MAGGSLAAWDEFHARVRTLPPRQQAAFGLACADGAVTRLRSL